MEDNLKQEETVQEEMADNHFEEVVAEPETNSQDDAKKFQSMYDKKSAEYDKMKAEYDELKQLEKLGNVLKERPDVVEAMKQTLNGEQTGNVSSPQDPQQVLDENSFDPWEAYYKPGSPSYEMRVREQKSLVDNAVKEKMKGIQETMAVNNLKKELSSKYNMTDQNQVDDFVQFATKPRQDVPLDILVDVYRKFNKIPETITNESIEAVKRTKNIPQTAGVLQGGEPSKPNELDEIWNGVIGTNSRNNNI